MRARWNVKEYDPEAVGPLAEGLGVASLTARVLVSRGLTEPERARAFLHPKLSDLPDPLLIPGMQAAATRLARAVKEGEQVWIYTDFDADGVTSAALLGHFFESLGVNWKTRLPRRDLEGYGLHVEPLREMAAEGGGVVVTADCGITAVEAALVARELGLGLVITDHHMPAEELPDADAVVNPKIEGSDYPDQMIAGVGVAWNLIAALKRQLRDEGFFNKHAEPDLRDLMDLVAMGTVADVVPLREVNRIFASFGVMVMNRDRRPGIHALAEVAGLSGELKAGHVSFQLAPRINAAGRMEGPREAVDLLMAGNIEQARGPASKLDKLNRERRKEEAAVLKAAVQTVHDNRWQTGRASLVVDGDKFHQGVIGIVASRLVERFGRPTVVLAVDGDTAKGSARSIRGLDLHEALGDCAHLLVKFGGHRAAAGLTIEKDKIDQFREAFEQAVDARMSGEDFIPLVEADIEADPGEVTLAGVDELSRLEPFGFGNPTPSVLLRGLNVRDRRHMGRDGEHLQLKLQSPTNTIEAVGWSKAQKLHAIRPGDVIDLIGALKVREWGGKRRVQITIEDARPSEPS